MFCYFTCCLFILLDSTASIPARCFIFVWSFWLDFE